MLSLLVQGHTLKTTALQKWKDGFQQKDPSAVTWRYGLDFTQAETTDLNYDHLGKFETLWSLFEIQPFPLLLDLFYFSY